MVRIAALLIAAAAPVAAPAQAAEAPAPALADVVRTSLFETCPSLVTGEMKLSDPATVRKLGLTRGPPDLEQKLAHPRMGTPEMAGRPVGGNFVALAVYTGGAICNLTFGGPDLDAAHQSIRAQIAADPALYQPDPAASGERGKLIHQAFRYRGKGRSNFLLTLASPAVSEPNPVVIASIGLVRE